MKSLRESFGETWLKNGVVHHIAGFEPTITLDTAKEIALKHIKMSKGVPTPLILNLSNVRFIDLEVREFWASGFGLNYVTALAFIAKNSMQKLLIESLIMIHKPKLPVRIFQDKQKAMQWLQYYKNVN